MNMKIIVEFEDGFFHEIDSSELNPKQIELLSHILQAPKILDGQNK